MEFTLTRKDLFDWLIKTPKRCHYCDLADLKLQEHFWKGCKRFYENLQIDRKNNSLPYTIDNICFACHICNATKSNIFTYEEFCDIGQRYLKPKWQANLKHLMVV